MKNCRRKCIYDASQGKQCSQKRRIFGIFFSLLGLGIEKISMHYFLEKRSYLHYNILFPAFQAGNKNREVCVKESEKLMEKLGIHGYFK